MKRVLIIAVAAALAAGVSWGEWVYEGQWGKMGWGNGEFLYPWGIDVAPNGDVYVTEEGANPRVQYFTPKGSFLGKWGSKGTGKGQFIEPLGLAIARNRNVYVADGGGIQYFTATGSFLGKWPAWGQSLAISPYGNVYCLRGYYGGGYVQYFTGTGSLLGMWYVNGRWVEPRGVAFSPGRTVYVTESGYPGLLKYYTRTGTFIGSWGKGGYGITIASSSKVYVTDTSNRVSYFTATGSFLGSWGSSGSGKGQFRWPADLAFSPNGARLYVTDNGNHRVQYFRWSPPSVAPTSLGKVKALFR
jgi:DNA-binding beta-propeller fold protein YncE